jgi:hypothetical protein
MISTGVHSEIRPGFHLFLENRPTWVISSWVTCSLPVKCLWKFVTNIYKKTLSKAQVIKTMWQKITQAGTRVPRVPIFKQWTDHIYPQKRFLNPKCITHRKLRYSSLNHFKECTYHLVPLDYHPSVQTNVERVSQIPLASPGYHLGIFVWSFQGIITNDTLTENRTISSHLCENQFLKRNKFFFENQVKSDPLPRSRSQGLAAIKN